MEKQKITKLLIAALKPEWSFLKQDLSFSNLAPGLFKINNKNDIMLLQTGFGLDGANKKTTSFFKDFQCNEVLHFGSSGALIPEYKATDLFIAHTLIFNDDKINLSQDHSQKIRQHLHSQKIACHTGALLSVSHPLNNATEKKEASKKHQAQAVDMESYMIAKACLQNQTSYISVRAIFDELHEDIETLGLPFDKTGDFKTSKFMGNLITHPKLILKLPELQKRHQKMNQNLKKAILWFLNN